MHPIENSLGQVNLSSARDQLEEILVQRIQLL